MAVFIHRLFGINQRPKYNIDPEHDDVAPMAFRCWLVLSITGGKQQQQTNKQIGMNEGVAWYPIPKLEKYRIDWKRNRSTHSIVLSNSSRDVLCMLWRRMVAVLYWKNSMHILIAYVTNITPDEHNLCNSPDDRKLWTDTIIYHRHDSEINCLPSFTSKSFIVVISTVYRQPCKERTVH